MTLAGWLSLAVLSGLGAYEIEDLYISVSTMRRASAPSVLRGKWLLLSYQSATPVQEVGASFFHEDFQKFYRFTPNAHGVFTLVLPLPQEKKIEYRLIVDGLWMTDPSSPHSREIFPGVGLSYLILGEGSHHEEGINPQIRDQHITLSLRLPPGKRVSVAGSFNHWDPFMAPMEEISPGCYQITLRLPEGKYGYYFIVNGVKMLDPLNFARAESAWGERVSLLSLGKGG